MLGCSCLTAEHVAVPAIVPAVHDRTHLTASNTPITLPTSKQGLYQTPVHLIGSDTSVLAVLGTRQVC